MFEDVDELFAQKPMWTSETKTVGTEIPEFLDKIDKKEVVRSPRFKLAGVEFYIKVEPGNNETEFVCVSLVNCSDKNQTTSVNFTEESGVKSSWQMVTVGVNTGKGFTMFLSHGNYKTWAKKHGDVFKLKTKVTLHQQLYTAEDDWISYVVILYDLFRLV